MNSVPSTKMNWDLSSYFPKFDGPDMIEFKQALQDDMTSIRDKAGALAPLNPENATLWEEVFLRSGSFDKDRPNEQYRC